MIQMTSSFKSAFFRFRPLSEIQENIRANDDLRAVIGEELCDALCASDASNYAEALRRVGEGLHPMNLPQRGKFRRGLGRAAGEGVAEGEGFNKKYFHS